MRGDARSDGPPARAALLLVITPIHPKGRAGHPDDGGGGRDLWLAADAPKALELQARRLATR